MEFLWTALIGVGAVTAWSVLAGLTALLAGRMIHERDAHDRPVAARPRIGLAHR